MAKPSSALTLLGFWNL